MFIKIFTYHNTVNIGAILQSRILKDFIEINSFLVNWLSNSKNFLINSINKSIK